MNKALDKLKEVNLLYRGVRIDETWENVRKEEDPSLWSLLTNENAENDDLQTDTYDDYKAQENTKNADYNKNDRIPGVPKYTQTLQCHIFKKI